MVFRGLLPAVLWALLILVLTQMPSSAVDPPAWLRIPYRDKVVHALLFGILAFLLARALLRRAVGAWSAWNASAAAFITAVAYGAFTELLQHMMPYGREGDVADLMADAAGALAGVMPACLPGRFVRWKESGRERR